MDEISLSLKENPLRTAGAREKVVAIEKVETLKDI